MNKFEAENVYKRGCRHFKKGYNQRHSGSGLRKFFHDVLKEMKEAKVILNK